MARKRTALFCIKKKDGHKIIRDFNTAVFLLRCVQVGINLSELHLLTMGMVTDILTENANDGAEYDLQPTQDDFDHVFN